MRVINSLNKFIKAQFGSYYYFKKIFAKVQQVKESELGYFSLLTLGSISGYFCWLFSYPQDVIKTKIQSDITGNKYKKNKWIFDGGYIDCAKIIWNKEGK